jgi:hypothetical protein
MLLAAGAAPALAAGHHATPRAAAAAATPDISGVWGRSFQRPGVKSDPRLVPPPAAEPELTAAYAADWKALREAERQSDLKGEPLANTSTVCLPDGMPQMMFAIYPLEILQTRGQVTIIEEAYSQVRRVYMDKPQMNIEDVPPGYYGHSVGHWESDTLVVDTVGVKESVRGMRDLPHTDQMRITERLHLIAPDILQDQITLTDPKVLVKPWTTTFVYKRLPNYEMLEYVCENNREYVDDKGVTHVRLGK